MCRTVWSKRRPIREASKSGAPAQFAEAAECGPICINYTTEWSAQIRAFSKVILHIKLEALSDARRGTIFKFENSIKNEFSWKNFHRESVRQTELQVGTSIAAAESLRLFGHCRHTIWIESKLFFEIASLNVIDRSVSLVRSKWSSAANDASGSFKWNFVIKFLFDHSLPFSSILFFKDLIEI